MIYVFAETPDFEDVFSLYHARDWTIGGAS